MPTYYVTNRTVDATGAFVQPSLPAPSVKIYTAPDGVDASLFANFAFVTDTPLPPADDQRLAATLAQQAIDAVGPDHLPLLVVFIHGFNNDPNSALGAMNEVTVGLANNGVIPLMVCFDWASNHEVWDYLTDQGDAMRSVPAVIQMLHFLDQWRDPKGCKVSVCVIAHSMGTFVLEQGMKAFARTLGNPVSMPYLNEVLLVAADIDSDTLVVGGDGTGITSLSRRVTVYFSKWDNTLGLSTLLKHSGTARLGRNGPNDLADLPRNVVAVDCTDLIKPLASNADILAEDIQSIAQVHSSYWTNAEWCKDASNTLTSLDRTVQTLTPAPTRDPLIINGVSGVEFKLI